MGTRRFAARRAVMACMLFVALLLAPAALASEPTPSPTPLPPDVIFGYGDSNVQIGELQTRLAELGYYTQPNLTMKLDEATQWAIYHCCQENGLTYPEHGLTYELWDCILVSGDLKSIAPTPTPAPTVTPTPPEYVHLYYTDRGDRVTLLQARLKELGYFDDNALTPGIYDEGTQSAIYQFCEQNGMNYLENGIDIPLQRLIFSDAAKPVAMGAAAKVPLSERFKSFLTARTAVGSISVPRYVFIELVVLLLVGCALLAVHFFVPSGKKPAPDDAPPEDGPPAPPEEPPVAPPPGARSQRNALEIQISYGGNTRTVQHEIVRALKLGRSEHMLELDPKDVDISRKHCELYYKGAILMLRDYSTNGTRINGALYHNCECRVNSGDVINIGNHELKIAF